MTPAAPPFDAVVIGNVGLDTNVYHPGGDVDFGRESNFTENLDYVGQAGGYTSRGFAQLGYRTAFVGYVGDDFSGRFVRRELAADGVDTTALFVDPAGTSRSVNMMFADGRRKNFYDGKSHMTLAPDLETCAAVLAGARLAHFHLPDWARRLLPIARGLGATVACDLQDVTAIDDPYRRDFVEHADVLFFSAANPDDPAGFLRRFAEPWPEKVLVMGMGARGCGLAHGGEAAFFDAVELDAPVVDTNGAGDGLAVGFLAAHVLEGRPLGEAVLRGQIAARHTCALKASSSRLIRRDELERLAGIALDAAGSSYGITTSRLGPSHSFGLFDGVE